MGQTSAAQFGFCRDCKEGDHEACGGGSCRCRGTEAHRLALDNSEVGDDEKVELPEDFIWEEPPPQQGRHPLTPEKQRMLKTRPGKFAHIKHYEGKSSAYQVFKNFNAGKFKDLDMTHWEFRHVKDGAHGPGSDVYVAYIGE